MNIKELCRNTGTLVHIDKDLYNVGDSTEQVVNVQGPPTNVLNVLARILQCQQDHKEVHPEDGSLSAKDGSGKELREDRTSAKDPSNSDHSGRPSTPPPPWC